LGNTNAQMVELIENYPLYTTPVTASNPGWTCDNTTRTCTYNLGQVGVNDPIKAIQFTVQADSILPTDLTQICNSATITNTECDVVDICTGTATASACVQVSPGIPDTGIEKEGYIARLIYQLTYYNNGSADASDVLITETIPAGAQFNANLSDSRWVCVGSTCSLTLSTFPREATEVALFVVDLIPDFEQPPMCWNNTATINNGNSPNPEPSPGDNTATFQMGACGSKVEIECPNPCVECPACNCMTPACNCQKTVQVTCPAPICSCPTDNSTYCSCDQPVCNCPSQPACNCGNLDCDCPAACEKIVEECGCKEIININLPCGLMCGECPESGTTTMSFPVTTTQAPVTTTQAPVTTTQRPQ